MDAKLSQKVSTGLEGLFYGFDGNDDNPFFAIRARLTYHMNRDGSLRDVPVANWGGFYVGLNGGALFGNGDAVDRIRSANGNAGTGGGDGRDGRGGGVDGGGGGGGGGGAGGGGGGAAALAIFADNSIAMGGGHVGYNIQYQNWVYGIEGDGSAVSDIHDYVASVRGRLGWVMENALVYATTGVAFTKNDGLNASVFLSRGGGNGGDGGNGVNGGPGVAGNNGGGGGGGFGGRPGAGGGALVVKKGNNDIDAGFVVGTGMDVKLSQRFSIGLEGLYYLFDDQEGVDFFVDGKPSATVNNNNDFYVVRARLTYHFAVR